MRTTWTLLTGYVKHRPLAAALAIGLLALGVGVLSLVVLLDRQLTLQFERNQAGIDLVIGAKGSPLQLVTSTIYHADAPTGNIPVKGVRAFGRPGHPLIQRAVPLNLGDSYGGRRIVGTTVDTFLALYEARIETGSWSSRPYDVVAGATAARQLKLRVGDTFASVHGLDDNPDLVHANGERFRVVGLLAPTGLVVDELLVTALETVWAVHSDHSHASDAEEQGHIHDHGEGHEHGSNSHAALWYENTEQDITALLAQFGGRNTATLNFARNVNENTDLMAATPAVVMAQFSAQVAGAERILRALAGAIVFASLVSLLLVLLNALRERRGDLGLLRSLGASPGFVFRLVLSESMFLATLGVLLGFVLGRVGFWVLGRQLSADYPVGPQLYALTATELSVGGLSLMLALVAALYPAYQAYRIDPALADA